MADLSPEALQKLMKNSARTRPQAQASGVAGLSAGDKMELMSGFEKIINSALTGSTRMGGKQGIVDILEEYISNYSIKIQEEMRSLFNKVFGKIQNSEKEDTEVKVDEKQYEELHKKVLEDTFNDKVIHNLKTNQSNQLKSFLKSGLVKSIFKSKFFTSLTKSIKNVTSAIKTSVISVVRTVLPELSNLTQMVSNGFDQFRLFAQNFIKFSLNITKSISMLVFRTSLILFKIALMSLSIIGVVISSIASVITFMIPVVATISLIALKILFVVGILALLLLGIMYLWSFFTGGDFHKTVNEMLSKSWNVVKDWFQETWDYLYNVKFPEWWQSIQNWFNTEFMKFVDNWLVPIYQFIEPVFNWLGGMFLRTWDWLKTVPVIGEFFKWYESTLRSWVDSLNRLFFGDGPFINRLIDAIIKSPVVQGLKVIGDWLLNTFKTGWGAIVDNLTFVIDWWVNNFRSAWDTVYGWVESIVKWIDGAIGKVSDAVGQGISVVKDSVKSVGETVTYAAEQTWSGIRSVGSALNPFNWFANGGIVDQPTLAVIGEKIGTSEAVIPLDARGVSFLSEALMKSGTFGSKNFMINIADLQIDTLKNTFKIQDALGQLYKYATNKEINYNGITTSADGIDPKTWLAEGGIVRKEMIAGVGEEGPEMVIPLNQYGVDFIRNVLKDEVYSSSGSSKMDELESKINMIIKMMKTGRSSNGTPITTNKSNNTSNYVDMIARGII